MPDIERRFAERRSRMCGSKRGYATEVEAQDAAYRHRLETGEQKDAYRCEFCGRWHIGGRPD